MKATKNIVRWFILVMITLFVNGCATAINGTKGPFEITTEPPMATVEIWDEDGDHRQSAWTPHTFVVPKKHDFFVKIHKDGYEDVVVRANSFRGGFSLGQAGTIATTVISPVVGVPGLAVDHFSGALRTRNGIHVKLLPLQALHVSTVTNQGAVYGMQSAVVPVVQGTTAVQGTAYYSQPVRTWSPFPTWSGADGVPRDFTSFKFGKVHQDPLPSQAHPAQQHHIREQSPQHFRPAGGLVTNIITVGP